MRQVWIGLVEVRPLPGCEILTDGAKGAFVQMLTWASSAAEFAAKVNAALPEYDLFATSFANERVVADSETFEDALLQDAFDRIRTDSTLTLLSTFHCYLHDEA